MRCMSACRRWVLAVLIVLAQGRATLSAEGGRDRTPVPVIHITDLHRPHNDPDDHWDLACVYALAHRGDIELKAVVIDYPPENQPEWNPDLAAVAQMNRITGLAVPVVVGTPHPVKSRDDAQPYASAADHQGIDLILDILRTSERPVAIHVIGGCRDIAVAGKKAPDLFTRNCSGVYLNAGTGEPKKASDAKLEYNVTLDRFAYEAVFDLPCPVYWMPCFETLDGSDPWRTAEFGTYYRFRQGEILPHLSTRVQNYLAYMFARRTDQNWLRILEGKPDEAVLADQAAKDRNMWCTAGFFHAAGYTITYDGATPRRDTGAGDAVFSFDPIRLLGAGPDGSDWTPDPNATNRFIFHVRDTQRYGPAATQAMKTLLGTLP